MEKTHRQIKKLKEDINQNMPIVVTSLVILFIVLILGNSSKNPSSPAKVVANMGVIPDASKIVDNLHNAVVTSLPNTSSKVSAAVSESETDIMSLIILSLVVILILAGGLKYLFNFDIYAELKNFFTSPNLRIDMESKREKSKQQKIRSLKRMFRKNKKANSVQQGTKPLLGMPEVFHISDNVYNYEQANAICKAFDSKLATYEQVEDAYNNGAEWCSYGWSDNGLALFPIQKETYNKLQKIKGHENDCGRPGVNGGFIPNKEAQFGVNCYGVKPLMTDIERKMMDDYKVYPKSDEEKRINKKTNEYKEDLSKVIINPFNKTQWTA